MTLAEILAEGRRLHAGHDAATMRRSLETADRLVAFYSQHGPALIAVAAAALEMRRNVVVEAVPEDDGVAFLLGGFERALTAFDAAARGAWEGE